MSKYSLDGNAVAYISKHPTKMGEERPFHNTIDIINWAMSLSFGGPNVPDNMELPCYGCARWDGRYHNDPEDRRRTRDISPRAARRPPGAVRRAGCHGCFVSFYDRHERPRSTSEQRQRLLELFRAVLAEIDEHVTERKRRVRLAREWDHHLDDSRRRAFFGLRELPPPPIPEKERRMDKAERQRFDTRTGKLHSRREHLREQCLKAGFDPTQVLASGGMTLP